MTYSYTAGTNKISSIADAGNTTQGGFRASSGAMTYDANGNMISNVAKGITSISYNYLNLPTNITITGGKTIDFTYDAIGIKLRKVVKTGATINLVQEYVNGIEYRGSAIPASSIEAAYHPEGRLYNSAGSWKREYTIKDHLGNTRIAYCDLDNNEVVATPSEILQENNYDAFGYELSGVYINHVNSDNLYQYNGKEKNDDHGIGMYDYGTRWYDSGIGRWTTVDPMADNNEMSSSFHYASNNPILMIDPDGMDDIYYNQDGTVNRRINNDQPDRHYSGSENDEGVFTVGSQLNGVPDRPSFFGVSGVLGRIWTGGNYDGNQYCWEGCYTGPSPMMGMPPDIGKGSLKGVLSFFKLLNPKNWNNTGQFISKLSKTVSGQKQARHLMGSAGQGKGYLNSMDDAQKVLDAVHTGKATILGTSKQGHLVVKVEGVVGTNVNIGAGFSNQSTNVFLIKGTTSPSIVPTSPTWKP